MAQCTAKSKQSGNRCRQSAIKGGNVCKTHGGSAPQVRKAAALRLAALVDPAIGVASKAMKDYDKDPPTALRAAFGVLDRNGYGPTQKHQVTGVDEQPIELNVSARELLAREIASLASEEGSDSSLSDGGAS